MSTFSLKRDLTLIMKNSRQEFCRIWGRNALGKYSGVTLSTRGTMLDSDGTGGVTSDDGTALTLPVCSEDVEVVTIPEPSTYFPLPDAGNTPDPPPLGAMFCNVYEKTDGRLEKMQDATTVDDTSELSGGLTGPGIEFLFSPSVEEYRETEWELSVPAFRDPMNPTIPTGTVSALFEYGSTTTEREERPGSNSTSKPTLRSAI